MDQKNGDRSMHRKNGTKNGPYFLDQAFRWPKTFGTKMGQSLDARETNEAKMGQTVRDKKWANLAPTSKHKIHGTKKGEKHINIFQANPQLSMHIFKT